jgi:valyl-tRNA synthetase
MKRDEDVLDTWFSSALWPFSVLDWDFENPSEFFKKYYPANVLETGYDILFFWVIRMLLMGYEYTGETPFKLIYLHGLALNEDGKKMSKSAGTVINPLTVIDEYSADALRLALVLGNTPGNNLNFSIKSVEEYSLFLNKFWNISRFVWMNIGTISTSRDELWSTIEKRKNELLPYETWIISRLSRIITRVTTSMEDNTFATIGSELMSFIRDEFADLAIESYKIEKENSKLGKEVQSICILEILTLMHPYIPHITEMLYGYITGGGMLSTSTWSRTYDMQDSSAEVSMDTVFQIVRTVRNIRAESEIKPGELRDVHLIA